MLAEAGSQALPDPGSALHHQLRIVEWTFTILFTLELMLNMFANWWWPFWQVSSLQCCDVLVLLWINLRMHIIIYFLGRMGGIVLISSLWQSPSWGLDTKVRTGAHACRHADTLARMRKCSCAWNGRAACNKRAPSDPRLQDDAALHKIEVTPHADQRTCRLRHPRHQLVHDSHAHNIHL